MTKISLTQNKHALIDDSDVDMVGKYKWNYTSHGYAETRIEGKLVRMHRLIMSAPRGVLVDHINMNGIDNRKSNLRLCTKSENMRNRNKTKLNTSGYKGVVWDKVNKKWRSQIRMDGKNYNIGRFLLKRDAVMAYNNKAKEFFGQFARLNNI
jgi:hypothetical protein